jgi:hypothetical protein
MALAPPPKALAPAVPAERTPERRGAGSAVCPLAPVKLLISRTHKELHNVGSFPPLRICPAVRFGFHASYRQWPPSA